MNTLWSIKTGNGLFMFALFGIALSVPTPNFAQTPRPSVATPMQAEMADLRNQAPVMSDREKARRDIRAAEVARVKARFELEKKQSDARFYYFGIILALSLALLGWLGWRVVRRPPVVGSTPIRGLVLGVSGIVPMLVLESLSPGDQELRAIADTLPSANWSFHMTTFSIVLAATLIGIGTFATVYDKGLNRKLGLLLAAVPPVGFLIALVLRANPIQTARANSATSRPVNLQGPGITIYHLAALEFMFALLGLMAAFFGILLRLRAGDVWLVVAIAGVWLAIVMGFRVLYPAVRLQVTDQFLYTGQYDLAIPWDCISEIFVWEPKLNAGAKILLRAARRGKKLPAVIGVTLTEEGLKRFGRPADRGIYKGLYTGCDVAIRTVLWNFLLAKVTQTGLIDELQKRVSHAD